MPRSKCYEKATSFEEVGRVGRVANFLRGSYEELVPVEFGLYADEY